MKEQIVLLKAWIDSMPATAIDHQVQHNRLALIEEYHNQTIETYKKEINRLSKELEVLKSSTDSVE